MKLFVDKLQKYYNKTCSFQKSLLLFCAVGNKECNPERFIILYDNKFNKTNYEKYEQRAMVINFLGNYKIETDDKIELQEITDEDITYIDTKMKELDGTLLVDIIVRFMETHKIFN